MQQSQHVHTWQTNLLTATANKWVQAQVCWCVTTDLVPTQSAYQLAAVTLDDVKLSSPAVLLQLLHDTLAELSKHLWMLPENVHLTHLEGNAKHRIMQSWEIGRCWPESFSVDHASWCGSTRATRRLQQLSFNVKQHKHILQTLHKCWISPFLTHHRAKLCAEVATYPTLLDILWVIHQHHQR